MELTELSEDAPGWVARADDTSVSLSNDPVENGYDVPSVCEWCGQELDDDDPDDVCMSPQSEDDRHAPIPAPLSWVNSVHAFIDPQRDEVWVSISVGDPRGAFVMRAERMRWTDDDGDHDEIRLSVPSPDQSLLHMPLTPLASPGYFRVGN